MAAFKVPGFEQRAASSKAAKARALANLRDANSSMKRATPAEWPPVSSRAAAAAAERRAAHKAAIEDEKTARAEARARGKADKEGMTATQRSAPVATVPTPSELKAARDARYAARKDHQQR